jgi:hypothetical protein
MAYLVHDVFERVGAVNSETNKDDVGFGVGQRSQSVVFFLTSSVPQSELDHLACGQMRGLGDVVFKDGRHVFLRRSAWRRVGRAVRGRTSGKLPEL